MIMNGLTRRLLLAKSLLTGAALIPWRMVSKIHARKLHELKELKFFHTTLFHKPVEEIETCQFKEY